MTDFTNNANGASPEERRPRIDADRGREPELISGRLGTRRYSQAALLERIEAAFHDEFRADDAPLREAASRADRLRLLRETVDYVLAVESIHLSNDDLAALLRQAYSRIFGYGPLDPLIADADVTTITIEGAERIAVRHGPGELTTLPPIFDDEAHLRQVLTRLLAHAGASLDAGEPVLETGLVVEGRPLAFSVAGPPASPVLSADIRLHPAQPPDLDVLAAAGVLTPDAAAFLIALASSPYGIVIAGEGETGKTTLLNALALRLPDASGAVATVERAGVLRLAPEARRYIARWPFAGQVAVSFAECARQALNAGAATLLVDEVRAGEPEAIAPLLQGAGQTTRLLWALRAAPDAKRLQAGLGMLARRADPTGGETLVHTLYERLPFVVSLARVQGRLQLFSIGEWQPTPASDYPDYVLLYRYQDGAARPTGRQPHRPVAPDGTGRA